MFLRCQPQWGRFSLPFRRREIEAMACGIVQPRPGSREGRFRF